MEAAGAGWEGSGHRPSGRRQKSQHTAGSSGHRPLTWVLLGKAERQLARGLLLPLSSCQQPEAPPGSQEVMPTGGSRWELVSFDSVSPSLQCQLCQLGGEAALLSIQDPVQKRLRDLRLSCSCPEGVPWVSRMQGVVG